MKMAEMESTMTEKTANYVEEAVRLVTVPLIEELNKTHTEIARLKAIINKDSSNSSKPSSTNGFKVIPNSREKKRQTPRGPKGTSRTQATIARKYGRIGEAGNN